MNAEAQRFATTRVATNTTSSAATRDRPSKVKGVPLHLEVAAPIASLPLLVMVAVALRNDHSHPHRRDERFLWQTNLLFNLVIVYLALETASPLITRALSRLGSTVVDVGVQCDFIAAWSFATACLIPVEFYAASGDVAVRRSYMLLLYAGLLLLLAVRVVVFVSLVRRIGR